MREGPHAQGSLTYRLERLDPDTWRFHHHPGGTIASYDFRLQPREIADFAARSRELSTSAESTYVTTLVAARPIAGHTLVLLPRTLRRLGADGGTSRTIGDADELARTLSTHFLVPLDDHGLKGCSRCLSSPRERCDSRPEIRRCWRSAGDRRRAGHRHR
ncbi:arylamine N-acetyltransferase [Nonomuraea africana]|uniref:arylamine N-acetyltransferase n=1 Tax=Nonomuraea africana TaxID=46171 RepID=UPI003CD07A88